MPTYSILRQGSENLAQLQPPAAPVAPVILKADGHAVRRPASLAVRQYRLTAWLDEFEEIRNVALFISLLLGAAALFGMTLVMLSTTASTSRLGAKLGALEVRETSLAAASRHASARQQEQIRVMQAQIAEIKVPPILFVDAQALFREGRYAEAEGAYGRFLLEFPDSRLRDLALLNSALANALLRNCSMARARLEALQKAFPQSISPAKQARIVATCESQSTIRQPS